MNRLLVQSVLLILFLISGACGLGCQVIWTKMFAAGLGQGAISGWAVVSAFLGGLVVGAWTLDRVLARTSQPGRWYAGLSWSVGLWCAITPWIIPWGNRTLNRWMGEGGGTWSQGMLIWWMAFLILLPATAGLGAMLPAMDRLLTPWTRRKRCVDGVHAMIFIGASFGVWITLFVLVPTTGFRIGLWILAFVNVVVGLVVWPLGRVPPALLLESHAAPLVDVPRPRLFMITLLTGMLGMVLVLMGARSLASVLNNTLYTHASILAAYLLALSCGATLHYRYARDHAPGRVLRVLLVGLSTLVVTSAVAMVAAAPLHRALSSLLGTSGMAVMISEWAVTGMVMGPCALCVGALFCLLAQTIRNEDKGVGVVWALYGTGGVFGGALFFVVFIPVFGLHWTLLLVAAGYLALVPHPLGRLRIWLVAPCVGLLLHLLLPWSLITPPAGQPSLTQHMSGAPFDAQPPWDNEVDPSTDMLQVHVALMLHPAPHRSLFLGADARRFLTSGSNTYDVMVANVSDPARDGSGFLLTREHFLTIQQRLDEDGLFCQWIPLAKVDRPVLDIMVATFLEVFPDAHAWVLRIEIDTPVLGLVSGLPAGGYADQWVERRLEDPQWRTVLEDMGWTDSMSLFGLHLAGPGALARLAHDAPVATDDEPLISFRAPAFTSRDDPDSHGRLMGMIREIRIERKDLEAGQERIGLTEPMQVRVGAFQRARDIYVEGLVYEAQDRRETAVEAFLSSARFSAEFTLGYSRCLNIATLLAEGDPHGAQRLLNRLQKVQPDNPAAADLLHHLFPTEHATEPLP